MGFLVGSFLLARSKTQAPEIGAAASMQLWGHTRNVVWTDSVQEASKNFLCERLSQVIQHAIGARARCVWKNFAEGGIEKRVRSAHDIFLLRKKIFRDDFHRMGISRDSELTWSWAGTRALRLGSNPTLFCSLRSPSTYRRALGFVKNKSKLKQLRPWRKI